jgi:hypothetical protein
MKRLLFVIKISIIAVFFFVLQPTQAQNGYILSGFRDIPQSVYLNPAFVSGAHVVVGIPVLSNFSEGLLSTGGGIQDYVRTYPGTDSLYLDLDKVINNGKAQDKVVDFLDNDFLFAGFKAGNTFITLGVRQHLFVQTIFDRDLLRLLWNGTSDYENETLNLDHTAVNEHQVMDYHIGISVPIGKRVRAGARFHFLQGLSDISTENHGIRLKTVDNNGSFELHARTNFVVNTAGIANDSTFTVTDYLSNFDNTGISVDLGVDIQVTKQISVNAAVLNWGKIHFRSNTKSFYSASDTINFNGADVDINNGDVMDNLVDTLQQIFDIKDESRNYDIKLPTRILIGGEYFTKDFRNDFSFLFSGRFYDEYFEPAVSIGYTRFVSQHFTVKADYTWIKDAPMNFGLAFALNFHPFQFYLYSENVPGLFSWDQQKYVQIGFGLNIRIAPRSNRRNPNNPQAIHNLRPDIHL